MTYSRPARPIAPRTFGRLLAFLATVLIFASPFTPQAQAQEGEAFAPADQAAFEDLVVGQRMIFNDDIFDYWEFMAEFSDAEWARTFAGAMAQTVASFKAGIPRFLRSPPSNATKKKETPGLTR